MAAVADKQKDCVDAENEQKKIIQEVATMEKSLQGENNKLKLATEQLERNELDFMMDLMKLETKLIDQEKTPKPKTTPSTTSSTTKTDPKASTTPTKTSTT